MTANALQLAKLCIGAVIAVGCLLLIAFQKKLGVDLDGDTTVALVSVVLLAGGVAGHGALKTPTKKEESE